MALDPFVGLYADETRMYSLLLLIALLVCGAFLRAFVLRRRGHLASLAILLALALYAHPWGAFLVAAAGLAWLALLAVGPSRRTLARDGVLAFGAAALLFAPWVPTLLYQAAHTGAPWSHRPTGRSLTRALARIWSGRRAELVLLPAAAVGLGIGALRGGRRVRRGVLGVAVIAVGDAARRLRLLALGDARVGAALPRRGARAPGAARRPRPRPARASSGRCGAGGGPVRVAGATRLSRRSSTRATSRRSPAARARAAARHARLLHPARAGARARPRTAAGMRYARRWARSPTPASWIGAMRSRGWARLASPRSSGRRCAGCATGRACSWSSPCSATPTRRGR